MWDSNGRPLYLTRPLTETENHSEKVVKELEEDLRNLLIKANKAYTDCKTCDISLSSTNQVKFREVLSLRIDGYNKYADKNSTDYYTEKPTNKPSIGIPTRQLLKYIKSLRDQKKIVEQTLEAIIAKQMPRKVWDYFGTPVPLVYPLSEAETRVQKLEKEYNEVLLKALNAFRDCKTCYTFMKTDLKEFKDLFSSVAGHNKYANKGSISYCEDVNDQISKYESLLRKQKIIVEEAFEVINKKIADEKAVNIEYANKQAEESDKKRSARHQNRLGSVKNMYNKIATSRENLHKENETKKLNTPMEQQLTHFVDTHFLSLKTNLNNPKKIQEYLQNNFKPFNNQSKSEKALMVGVTIAIISGSIALYKKRNRVGRFFSRKKKVVANVPPVEKKTKTGKNKI